MTEGRLSGNAPEMFKEALGHRNGTMPSSGTTDADMEVGFSSGKIKRDNILEKREKFFPENLRPLGLPDIVTNRLVLSRQMLKGRDVKGVCEKTDVKEEITVRRRAVFETEGGEDEGYSDGGIPEF